ncbi:hypothetical protein Scep_019916 [Stephania cephalantha]|uniref:ATP synthase F0 subunit 8 n=1 Tax=Stephania cephalantha TaxID=152367 RepID=A0AAP0IC70_9MAGN
MFMIDVFSIFSLFPITQAFPGPKVGHFSLPWLLAVPLAYVGITFVFAFVKNVRKFNSPIEKKRKLVAPLSSKSLLFFFFLLINLREGNPN